ncbi:MAG: CHAT domain-containing protein [Bryobacter sp.]|nr:CHAT domain-containing protein [Bryobacter sp.]
MRKQAHDSVQRREFEQAIQTYHALLSSAQGAGQSDVALAALNGIASCHYSLYQYREALALFEKALAQARQQRNLHWQGIIATNIGSLYTSLGENERAEAFLLDFSLDGQSIGAQYRLDWFLLQAQVFSRTGNGPKFATAKARILAEIDQPLANASSSQSLATAELRRAWAFDVLSDAHLEREETSLSLAYAEEAYRLRYLYKDSRRLRSLLQIVALKRRLNDWPGAQRAANAAQGLMSPQTTPMQSFRLHREQALLALHSGDTPHALAQFRQALAYPRRWRSEVLPSDSTFLHFEQFLSGQIQEEFLRAVANLPAAQWNSELAAEAFWVAEEGRYASHRAALFPRDEIARRLGTKYWQTLRRFEDLQSKVLSGDAASAPLRDELQFALTKMEAEAGLSIPHSASNPTTTFRSWQKQLPPDETLFNFVLHKDFTLAWAVNSQSLEMRRLPGRDTLAKLTQSFTAELRAADPNQSSGPGRQLSQILFGDFSEKIRTTPFWTMVIDDSLAQLPIAALPPPQAEAGHLLQSKTLRFLPSAHFARRTPLERWTPVAVGFGDPIYNQADSRSLAAPRTNGSPVSGLQLQRLPGTAAEVEAALHRLGQSGWKTSLFLGSAANRKNLLAHLQGTPAILHLSLHFATDPAQQELTSLLLSSSQPRGEIELFTAADLAAVRCPAKLVVLSGCSSFGGKSYAGLGLAGLTRGWLISGAESVIGTLWPTEDRPNPLFEVFYEDLAKSPTGPRAVALALRKAQLAMLERNDELSQARYWAAYVLMQRS